MSSLFILQTNVRLLAFASLVGLLAMVLLVMPSTGPDADDCSEQSLRIYALDGGSSLVPNKALFHPAYEGQGPLLLPVMAFLIVHPMGVLLWDTGQRDGTPDGADGSRVRPGRLGVRPGVIAQLASLGIKPCDIDYLALSHWHYDHTGNANAFAGPHTTIVGQRDEYLLAFSKAGALKFGMRPDTYGALRRNPTTLFMGDHDVFGDGRVRILRTPGHTVGSQMLLVELRHMGPVLLSGDLYHFEEQRTYRRVPAFNDDTEATLRSIDKIERLLSARPEIRLWITHDPLQMAGIALSPAYYF